MKQAPLLFILMTRRMEVDHVAVLKEICDLLPPVIKLQEVVMD